MRLITSLAILALASSDPVPYTPQPTEQLASKAEAYQSQLELQQQVVYGDQSQYSQQDFSQSDAGFQGHSVAFPSAQSPFAGSSYTGQSAFAGQNEFSGHAFDGQNAFAEQTVFQSQRPSTERAARIISYQNENKGKSYQYYYETENGIKAQEQGSVQGKTLRVQGGYSYTGDDGQVYTITYTADENGFRPQGTHLPTPSPIPEAIQKSIEQNARDAANNNGVFDDGSYKEVNEPRQQQHHQIQPQQHSQQIQQINNLQPIQIPDIHQHTPDIQQQQIQEIQSQNQHFQEISGAEYQQEYQTPGYQQEQYHQKEVKATTAGHNSW